MILVTITVFNNYNMGIVSSVHCSRQIIMTLSRTADSKTKLILKTLLQACFLSPDNDCLAQQLHILIAFIQILLFQTKRPQSIRVKDKTIAFLIWNNHFNLSNKADYVCFYMKVFTWTFGPSGSCGTFNESGQTACGLSDCFLDRLGTIETCDNSTVKEVGD